MVGRSMASIRISPFGRCGKMAIRPFTPFPPPPLKFRKVGFPDYGLKVGMSDGAFPSSLSLKPAPGIHDCFVGLHPSFARPRSYILIPF